MTLARIRQSAFFALCMVLAGSALPGVTPDSAAVQGLAEVGADDFRISDMGPDGNNLYGVGNGGIAFNATNNEFLVVWYGEEIDGEFEIYGQRLNAATGAEVGTNDFRISDMGPNGNLSTGAFWPAVAWNSTNNEYLVVWQGDDVDGEPEIYGQRLAGATGAETGTNDFRISDMGPDGSNQYGAADAAVAYNATRNEYLVVWRGDDVGAPDETEVYGQILNAATGAELGANDFRISDAGPAGDTTRLATSPVVAYNSTNQEYLVVWHGDDLTVDNDIEVFGQRINAVTGAEMGANDFRISDMGPENDSKYRAGSARVVYNPSVNEYLVVWIGNDVVGPGDDFVFEVYGQRLAGATGLGVGTNDFRISDVAGETDDADAGRTDVAWSPAAGEYMVVWYGDDAVPGKDEVWGQRLDVTGAEIGINDFRLSRMGPENDPNFDTFNPRVAFGASDIALVTWQSDDLAGLLGDNEYEIWGQLYQAASSIRGDFNGDGKTDLLWRNYNSGAVNVWLLNGSTYLSGVSLFTVPDPNWRIEGTGDFNGDGKTDLIWRHYGTGEVSVWFMNGTSYVSGASLFTVGDVNWKIQAVGDFNGDGKDDLIWRNYATGAVNVWFLDGTTYVGGANLFTVADSNWRIEVAADFNGDGKNDLIWRNYATGEVNVWFLNGTTYLSGTNLFSVAVPNWDIEAVGDYNGDGKNDLIWRHYGTGEVSVWYMNGATYLSGASLFTVGDVNWEIAGPR